MDLLIKFFFCSDRVNMTYLIAEIRSNTYFVFLASIFVIFDSDLGIRYLVVRDATYIPIFAEIKNLNFLQFFKTFHIFVQSSIRSSKFSGLFFNMLYVIVFKLWDYLKIMGLQIKFDFWSDQVNMTYLIAEIRSNTYFAFLASIFIIFYSDLEIRYLVLRDTTYI